LLEIKNLHAKVGDNEILRGLDLKLDAGQVHAIMGPNGSGKSTLAHVLSGRPGYTVTDGSVTYKGKDLLALSPENSPASPTSSSCARRSTPSASIAASPRSTPSTS